MGTHPIFESDFDCLTENVTKVTKMSDLEAYTWTEYEVDFDESLLSISVKFDTSIQLLKRKNKIGSDAYLWLGRRIMVPDDTCSLLPHEPPVPPMPALERQTTTTRSSPDPEDQDPEHIGFIKLDAFRLRLEDDQIIALSKVNHTEQIGGVLLVTPSAVMFDPSAPPTPELGLIIPINDVKRAALYNVNNNSRISWLQISSRETVAYFGVSVDNATPILRCLQKWSSAKFVATPGVLRRDTRTITGDRETPDLAICHSSLELHHNEEFFTETETEWQIEEGVGSMENSENDEMQSKDGSEIRETLDQAARIMPEMSASSHILNRDQIINLNNLLPARCIGATWHLRYSTRQNGTSLKTLVRACEASESPNLLVIKTSCNAIIGALASHPIRVSEHFFGSGETFLYRFSHSSQSVLDQFTWTGRNSFFIRCDRETLVFGSSEGTYAIWVEGSLLRGTSRKCATFANPILTRERDFAINNVEVWDFN